MTTKDIPPDSILHNLLVYMGMSEVPFSYQLACGLSTIGCVLRRNRYIDQVDWRVYPNQSILLVGGSGIGKDTMINRVQSTLNSVEGLSKVPTLGGVTMELIHARLAELGKPACAFIPAAEITKFFGKADYQANLLTGMTDLLSGGEKIDISTKGSYYSQGGKATAIHQPTLTMHCGSTVEWLHKMMPDGTLEGGFMGRFLIIPEEIDLRRRQVPLVKGNRTQKEIDGLRSSLRDWEEGLADVITRCKVPCEMILFSEAEDAYVNWYYNRFKLFSRAVMPYANRSRDMVLRLGMLMALSRRHDRWIEEEDIRFAIQLIGEVAAKIDKVVLPPSPEAAVFTKILDILPAECGEIYQILGMRYSIAKVIEPALTQLVSMGQILRSAKGVYRKREEDI